MRTYASEPGAYMSDRYGSRYDGVSGKTGTFIKDDMVGDRRDESADGYCGADEHRETLQKLYERKEGVTGTVGQECPGAVGVEGEASPKHVIHTRALAVGDRIQKSGGDYRFDGEVVAVFNKRNGVVRYVVENDDGILHIFSAANLKAPTS